MTEPSGTDRIRGSDAREDREAGSRSRHLWTIIGKCKLGQLEIGGRCLEPLPCFSDACGL
jgi:hypothetical protein